MRLSFFFQRACDTPVDDKPGTFLALAVFLN